MKFSQRNRDRRRKQKQKEQLRRHRQVERLGEELRGAKEYARSLLANQHRTRQTLMSCGDSELFAFSIEKALDPIYCMTEYRLLLRSLEWRDGSLRSAGVDEHIGGMVRLSDHERAMMPNDLKDVVLKKRLEERGAQLGVMLFTKLRDRAVERGYFPQALSHDDAVRQFRQEYSTQFPDESSMWPPERRGR